MPLNQDSPPVRSTPVPQDMRPSGLWAFESRHAESFSMNITQHPFLKLLWIREGAATIEFEADSLNCKSGELVIVPPQYAHRILDSPTTPVTLYGLGVDFKRIQCVEPVLPFFQAGSYNAPQFKMLQLEQQLRRILFLFDQADVASQLSSVAVAVGLIAELALIFDPTKNKTKSKGRSGNAPIDPAADPLLESYIDWLDRNFYEAVTLNGAAAASGMSRRTFTKQFKARTGATWLNYLTTLRVQRAEELLAETNRKVTSVAFQCGFEDLSTFYRAFKRIKGRTPLKEDKGGPSK